MELTINKTTHNHSQNTHKTLTHSLTKQLNTMSSIATKLAKINTMFSANAKPFVPGQQWMKPRRIKWHVRGITQTVHFDVTEGYYAPKADQPFTIPEPGKTIEEKLEDLYEKYPMIIPNESRYVKTLRQGDYGLGQPRLARIQPNRFNYCDN